MISDMKQPLLNSIRPGRSGPSKEERVIPVNPESISEDLQKLKDSFPKNVIVSSRYTIINFLPKSLLEQFRRLANVYFLVIGIIAVIGSYTGYYETAVEPAGILAPMMIVVFISVIKDGVEDFKRNQADQKINSQIAHRVTSSGSIESIEWRQIQVGDLLIIFGDEEIAADVVVLTCGGIQGPCAYVETAAIDGESNLKIKLPILGTGPHDKDIQFTLSSDKTHITGPMDRLRTAVTCEAPNSSIHRFNGSIEISPELKQALNEKQLLLRGSTLRATEWCLGSAAYTGADTKLSLNSKRPPSKLSSVDRIVNRTLVVAISAMIVVCIISMICYVYWLSYDNSANYLCLHSDDLSPQYSSQGGGGCESGAPISVLTIFTFATLYNNFVCISMYVSLEMIYLCQSYFVCNDLKLYSEENDTPAECHTSGMCADLGQIQYILSDKTGTLTKNQMVVQEISLARSVFGPSLRAEDTPPQEENRSSLVEGRAPQQRTIDSKQVEHTQRLEESTFHEQLTDLAAVGQRTDASLSSREKLLYLMLLRVLVYCNTAMIMPDSQGQQSVANFEELSARLQAESADEVALILFAAQYGQALLRKRNNHEIIASGLSVYYDTNNNNNKNQTEDERVELVAVNEFDSDRKMMSVIIKIPENMTNLGSKHLTSRYLLLVKGADSSVMKLCQQNEYSPFTLAHVDYFANTGLRTLVCAYRELSEADVTGWLTAYKEAANSITGRTEKMKDCALLIEKNLSLIGAIGIEDELQDGVPEAIKHLHSAGLNVWMITGDKAETAMAIGKKCALLQPAKHDIEKVLNLSDEALRQRIVELHKYVTLRRSEQTNPNNNPAFADVNNPVLRSTPSLGSQRSTPSPTPSNTSSSSKRSQNTIEDVALVIDGTSLEGLWSSEDLRSKFVDVIQAIPIVIACRVSPLQKASLVRMVKSAPGNPVTLGIGDGANDVGMIHESRVGVGISGHEGRHAANAADFAIGQFRFLVPLLFEHGRFNYIRCSKLVLYSFFKNLLLVSVLFYYCTYSGFSGSVPLDTIVFSGYNFYLGLPILVIGAMDFDIPREDVYIFPYEAYATGRKGELLNIKNMFRWCFLAFIQGLLIFIVALRFIGGPTEVESSPQGGDFHFNIYGSGLNGAYGTNKGSPLGLFAEGFLLYSVVVLAMQYKVVSMAVTPNWVFWALWLLSFAGYYLFVYLYGLFPSLDWYNIASLTMRHPVYWLALLLIPIMFVLSDYTLMSLWSRLDPISSDILAQKLAVHHEAVKTRGVLEGSSLDRETTVVKNGSMVLHEISSSHGSANSSRQPSTTGSQSPQPPKGARDIAL